MNVRILVTIERYDEVIDLDDSFDLSGVSVTRAYEYLCNFVVDADGNYVGLDAGKAAFKAARVKRAEIGVYWLDFVKKTGEAFVPPPSAAA